MDPSSLPGLGPVSPYLARSDLAVSFADPTRKDEPLVWVNGAFCRLTGYRAEECVGRNCRFLQGDGTEPESVARIRETIDSRRIGLTPLVNYRADGDRFTNGLIVGALGDADEPTQLLFGMQWNIDSTLERRRRRASAEGQKVEEPDIRLRHFERLIGSVVDASRKRAATAGPAALIERLVAVSRPQQYPPHERLPNWTRASSLLPYLAEPYGPEVSEGIGADNNAHILAIDVANPVALAVHELSSAVRRHTERTDRSPRQDISCGTVFGGGEPQFELAWRATLPVASDPDDGERALATRDGLAVVTEVATLVGGSFEVELSERKMETVLRVPNRLHEIPGGDHPSAG